MNLMDYKEIIDNLTDEKIMQLLDKLEIPYRNNESYIVCKTACHNVDFDEASWKLYYYKDTHLFVCYTHCENMSIFKFLRNYYEVRGIQYNWYEDVYQVARDCSSFRKEDHEQSWYSSIKGDFEATKRDIQLKVYPKEVLDCFIKWYPFEWLNDGISKAAMDKFNIRYSISQNKIIIPHYDVNNNLIGIRGRALNKEEVNLVGKYMPVKIENTWYSHPLSLNLYGLNFNKENIKKTGVCFLCESEKAVLQAESFPIPNCCVAVCGSNFNKYALNLLLKECEPREIVICFDNEEEKGQEKYFNKLMAIGKKYSNYCNFSFVYDDKHLTLLKDSPTDRGWEIFKQLLDNRIHIKEI